MNLNGSAYLTCTLLCKYYLVIMVIYIYIYIYIYGFWQIQIDPKDRYKTAFTVPFGQYEWNVMPFGLKNAPSEFQRIMNNIFNAHSKFCIVYIDDVLIFSHSIE